jgi:hypothetical protein
VDAQLRQYLPQAFDSALADTCFGHVQPLERGNFRQSCQAVVRHGSLVQMQTSELSQLCAEAAVEPSTNAAASAEVMRRILIPPVIRRVGPRSIVTK